MTRALCLLLTACAAAAEAQPADTLRGAVWVEGVFADAHALRADVAGRLYVADPGRSALFVFTPDGAMRATITGGNGAATTLREPVDVDPTNGLLLYVADSGAGRVFPIGADGLFLDPLGAEAAPHVGAFGEPQDPSNFAPRAVATTVQGDVLVLDAMERQLIRWDASRRRTVLSGPDQGVLRDPRALLVANERIYVLDGARVVVFDALGTRLRDFGQGVAARAVRIRHLGDRIVLVLPDGLVLFDEHGRREAIRVWQGAPLRDAVLTPDALLLLTPRALHRVPR